MCMNPMAPRWSLMQIQLTHGLQDHLLNSYSNVSFFNQVSKWAWWFWEPEADEALMLLGLMHSYVNILMYLYLYIYIHIYIYVYEHLFINPHINAGMCTRWSIIHKNQIYNTTSTTEPDASSVRRPWSIDPRGLQILKLRTLKHVRHEGHQISHCGLQGD